MVVVFCLFLRESTGEFCLFRHILLPPTPTHTHTPSRAQCATQKVFWKQLPLAHTWILLALSRPQGARSYLLFFLTQRGAPHPHSHTHTQKCLTRIYTFSLILQVTLFVTAHTLRLALRVCIAVLRCVMIQSKPCLPLAFPHTPTHTHTHKSVSLGYIYLL